MRKTIKKIVIALGMLLLIGQFASCDNSKKGVSEIVESIENTTETAIVLREPVVFITGYDKGENTFYSSARNYFIEKKYEVIDDAYSLQEIISWMNENATEKPYGEVHIVSYSDPWRGMNLETIINGERITAETLRKNITKGTLPILNNVVAETTNIVFHSCGLGENIELMKTLKDAFVADVVPNVIASPYYNIFSGEFSDHYLAKPFYVFYPTAHSPGKVDLSKEIARKYPEEREIDWLHALNNESERYVGEAYTYQFNIPVKWEFDYINSDNEIPTFTIQEEVMDWVAEHEDLAVEISKLEIPVEKFRWQWSVKNSKLVIKGKTTVLCVLKPLVKPYGELEHIEPNISNLRLYAMK